MIHYDFPQGSESWHNCRRGVITGSKFKEARERLADKTDKKTGEITRGAPSSRATLYAMNLARERCHGTTPKVFQNDAMRFGSEQEEFARRAYEAATGNLVEEVGFFKTPDGIFGLSPDGLIDDDGVLEIKTMVSSDTLFTALTGGEDGEGDISAYIDQINGYLWLLGRQWVDLVLWAPDMEELGLKMVVKRITRDEEAIQSLQDDLMAFADTVRIYESKLRKAAIKNQQEETT